MNTFFYALFVYFIQPCKAVWRCFIDDIKSGISLYEAVKSRLLLSLPATVVSRFLFSYLITFFISLTSSCNSKADNTAEDVAPEDAVTPVTIVQPARASLSETVEVNAVSSFLLKTYVKASAVGYLQSVNVRLGQYVSRGQTLFTIRTKEAEALGNTINSLDTSLHFEGTIRIKSQASGYITQLTYTSGNYVQDGEQLAEITDKNSFVFLLNLPYELKPYLQDNKTVLLRLPDSTQLSGIVQSALPVLDSVAQTQRIVIKVKTDKLIPENLIAKVQLVKSLHPNAVSLLKAAVLSNEEQTEFWIMQLINDSTAVKVPVKKGIETATRIEIVSPPLTDSDRIVSSGNYGLSDTAKVSVEER